MNSYDCRDGVGKSKRALYETSGGGGHSVRIKGKGDPLERSDIDIAVSGADDIDALEEEIPTLLTVDLLDMDTCRNELILEDIRKYGRKI